MFQDFNTALYVLEFQGGELNLTGEKSMCSPPSINKCLHLICIIFLHDVHTHHRSHAFKARYLDDLGTIPVPLQAGTPIWTVQKAGQSWDCWRYTHTHTGSVSTRKYMYTVSMRQCWPWFGNVKVDEVGSLVALEVILLVDLHCQVEVSLTPLLTTKGL